MSFMTAKIVENVLVVFDIQLEDSVISYENVVQSLTHQKFILNKVENQVDQFSLPKLSIIDPPKFIQGNLGDEEEKKGILESNDKHNDFDFNFDK